MKKAFPLLLVLLGLGLTSCGDADSSSSDIILSGNTVATIESDSEPEESSSEEPNEWPADELAAYINELFGSDVSLPTPSDDLASGKSFDLSVEDDVITITATGDFTAYKDEVLSSGWMSPTVHFYEGGDYLHSPDFLVEMLVNDYDQASDTTTIEIESTKVLGYFAAWPENIIARDIDGLLGVDGSTALPTVEEGYLYTVTETEDNTYEIHVYSESSSSLARTYQETTLLEEGFIYNNYSSPCYLDPEFDYMVRIYTGSDGYFTIEVQSIGNDYIVDWDDVSELAASFFATYSSSDVEATLPSPAFDWQMAAYYQNNGVYKYLQIYLFSYVEGALIDVTEEYGLLMDQSDDWTSIGDYMWTDTKTKTIKVNVYNYLAMGWGTAIDIEAGDYSSYL